MCNHLLFSHPFQFEKWPQLLSWEVYHVHCEFSVFQRNKEKKCLQSHLTQILRLKKVGLINANLSTPVEEVGSVVSCKKWSRCCISSPVDHSSHKRLGLFVWTHTEKGHWKNVCSFKTHYWINVHKPEPTTFRNKAVRKYEHIKKDWHIFHYAERFMCKEKKKELFKRHPWHYEA